MFCSDGQSHEVIGFFLPHSNWDIRQPVTLLLFLPFSPFSFVLSFLSVLWMQKKLLLDSSNSSLFI